MEDSLFQLVNGLSDREFLLVRTHLESKSAHRLLGLLVELRKMQWYSAQRLKHKFRALTVIRFRLRYAILNVLRSDREGHSVATRIRVHIDNFEILHERGCFKESLKEIETAEELASTFHCLASQIEIANLRIRTLLGSGFEDLKESILDIRASQKQLQALYYRELEIMNDFHLVLEQDRFDGRQGAWPLNKIIADEELYSRETPFYTRSFGLMIASIWAYWENNLLLSEEYMKNAFFLWQEHDRMNEEDTLNYKLVLEMYAKTLIRNKNYSMMETIVNILSFLPCRNIKEKAEHLQHLASVHLLLEVESGFASSVSEFIHTAETRLDEYQGFINPSLRFAIWRNRMLYFFVHNHYRESLGLINRIITHKRFPVGRRTQHMARVFEVIIWCEIDYFVDDSHLKSTIRYFYRQDAYTTIRRKVMEHILKLISSPVLNRAAIIDQFLKTLEVEEATSTSLEALEMRVIKAWAQSKSSGESMSDVLQKTSQQ
jgi:hypothetical protein